MRKNGVNKQLTEIVGGVCASDGFFAGAIHTGIAENTEIVSRETKRDFGVILTKGRYPFAVTFPKGEVLGASNKAIKRYVKGCVRAIVFNGKASNLTGENAEKTAVELCRAFSQGAKICPDEIAIVSTGAPSGRFAQSKLIDGMKELFSIVESSEKASGSCAEAIADFGVTPKQFSYGFFIGDIACKIGGIYKGRKAGKGGSSVCIMTTDVNVTSEMLDKALRSAVAESFATLDIDGGACPDDCVCITTSGKAGNYLIDRADVEYDKFVYALTETLKRVCLQLAKGDGETTKALVCRVENGTSKRAVKNIAQALLTSYCVRKSVEKGNMTAEEIIYAMQNSGEKYDFGKLEIRLCADNEEVVLYEERSLLTPSSSVATTIRKAKQVEIIIRLNDGNYKAAAISQCERLP